MTTVQHYAMNCDSEFEDCGLPSACVRFKLPNIFSEHGYELPVIKNKTGDILLTWQWLHQGAKNFTKWFPNATCSSKFSSVNSIKPSAITFVSWTDWKFKPIHVVYNSKFFYNLYELAFS